MTGLVTAGADRLWYDDTGGDGVPFVLLHPGITDSGVWDPLLPHLEGHRVVRFDRRGFGRSPRATQPYRAMDDLVAVLDTLSIERAHLVGNSMGGETSLALAVTAPERVASMTLLCPGISGYAFIEVEDPELEAAWDAAKAADDVPEMAAIQLRYWCASGADSWLERQLLHATELDLSDAAKLERPNPDQWEAAASLAIPTSVIAGELDPEDSLQASIDLAARIPGAELVRLDVDHVPQYREPGVVAEVTLRTAARAG